MKPGTFLVGWDKDDLFYAKFTGENPLTSSYGMKL